VAIGSLETDHIPAASAAVAREPSSSLDRAPAADTYNHPVIAALLVAAAYYLGAKLGLALTFSPHPISVLWPPNAILMGALLVAPVRWWWLPIAAAFPAHLAAELQGGVPLAMVLCWYLSNVSEALIGALFVHRFATRPVTLDSVQNVFVFVAGAVFLAPFLTSFLDAAFVVAIGWGQDGYWDLWNSRFYSNVLATLALVPLILTWLAGGAALLRTMTPKRRLEGAALLAGLLVVGLAVFDAPPSRFLPPAGLLYLPLPFLVWAALRFGPVGASTAFAGFAFLTILGASHGRGPFVAGAPPENALALQLFLALVGIMIVAFAAIMQERRNSEERLRSSEERFAKAFRAVPDAISISRKSDGTIIDVNDCWITTYGYSREEAVGRTVLDLDIYERKGDREKLVALAEAQDRVRNFELNVRTRRGEPLEVLLAAEVVEMEGEPCLITITRDVTDQRRAEHDAQEQRQQLTHLTRVTMLGELSGALAHELNQPLTAILSNAQAAQRLLARDPSDITEVRDILKDIVEADRRAGEVIRRLRAMFKKGEAQFVPLSVNDVLDEVLELAHGDLMTRSVGVATRYNFGVPRVSGDRVQLQQLLLNLVTNACESMNARDRSQRRLTVSTSYEWDGTVHVAVADTGPGIPPDRMDRLFEPFYTTKDQGLGLGLAICRTIAAAHGGRLWASTNADDGATFHLSIPTQGGRP
jgi:two-component system sensor kinase FixL